MDKDKEKSIEKDEDDIDTEDNNSHNTSVPDEEFEKISSARQVSSARQGLADDEESAPQEALKKIREKLKLCEKDKQEYLLGWQRMRADFVNAKRQAETEKAAFVSFAEIDLINDLLPVLSSFDAATQNKENWQKAPYEWRSGIESIHGLLLSTLKNRGLEIDDPKIGSNFDPSLHEAIEKVLVDEADKDNKILKVIERGFTLQGKVIKPPRVSVGEFKDELRDKS